MVYNISFDICALVNYLFILLFLITKKSSNQRQFKLFLMMIITAIVSNVADIVNAQLLNTQALGTTDSILSALSENAQAILLNISIYVYMLPHNLITAIFMFYLLEVTNKLEGSSFTRIFLYLIPGLVNFISIALINPFTGAIFYYSSDWVYHRGVFMPILYIVSFLYLARSLYLFIKFKSIIPANRIFGIVFFFIAVLFGVTIQVFFPYILLELFVQSFGFFCLLYTTENEYEVYNPITKVFNKLYFIEKNRHLLNSKTRYKLVLLKITNLTYYSQILGLDNINKILHETASFLTEITNKEAVFDCDQGNFVIFIYEKDEESLPEITRQIYSHFSSDILFNNMELSFNVKLCFIEVPKMVSSVKNILSIISTDFPDNNLRVSMISETEILVTKRRAAIQKAIQRALRTHSFQVYYQPILDCHDNKIHSAEALVRLFDDELGTVPPEEFIPIAEKDGTILEIGMFVFETVCRFYNKKNLSKLGITNISINLSPVQCMHKELPEEFQKIILDNAISASCINLEITESSTVNSPETFVQTIKALRNMRFQFSLDDYGTGYSNAAYIFNLDFDYIKLDKSILWEARQKAAAKIILDNTINMIRQMGIKIVMEGIETIEQKNFVAQKGVDYIQGFFYSTAIPETIFVNYVNDFNSGRLPQALQ